jgi:hypothetical protein
MVLLLHHSVFRALGLYPFPPSAPHERLSPLLVGFLLAAGLLNLLPAATARQVWVGAWRAQLRRFI